MAKRRKTAEVLLSRPPRRAVRTDDGPFPFYLDGPYMMSRTRAFWARVDRQKKAREEKFGAKRKPEEAPQDASARRPQSRTAEGRRQAWQWFQTGPSPALALPPVCAASSSAAGSTFLDGNGAGPAPGYSRNEPGAFDEQ